MVAMPWLNESHNAKHKARLEFLILKSDLIFLDLSKLYLEILPYEDITVGGTNEEL